MRGGLGEILTAEHNGTVLCLNKSGDGVEYRGLSCAVCADEGDYFTLLNVEGNALYCVYRAVIYL